MGHYLDLSLSRVPKYTKIPEIERGRGKNADVGIVLAGSFCFALYILVGWLPKVVAIKTDTALR